MFVAPPPARAHYRNVAGILTDAIEIAVGVACLGAAAGAWRRMRWLGALLMAAGAAAVIHGAAALATR
jgi:hypothetical protein